MLSLSSLPSIKDVLSSQIPPLLLDSTTEALQRLLACLSDEQSAQLADCLSANPSSAKHLVMAALGSEFIIANCCREPALLLDDLLNGLATQPILSTTIVQQVAEVFSDDASASDKDIDAFDNDTFDTALRCVRRRLMTALYWRDINHLADFGEVSQAMTAMAEAFIQKAVDFHYQRLSGKHGYPIGEYSGNVQPFLVIGMGKLGAGELNVSSDVDLIFAYPESGTTVVPSDQAKRRSVQIDNQQFFTRLGQAVIKSLGENQVEGFVKRVDMRLRPYGESGPLVSNFSALEHYYQSQGRDWERFAAIKARVVACTQLSAANADSSQPFIDDLYDILRPFTYRKYVDFSLLESLRKLKKLIEQEVRRKHLEGDIKLGRGGIREIEFIVQFFQLIRGGRDIRLQERSLLNALAATLHSDCLSEEEVSRLESAYLFLRKTEHALQNYQDQQTQSLPTDDIERCRLAYLVTEGDWQHFVVRLRQHQESVHGIFQQIIAEPDTDAVSDNGMLSEWQLLWSSLSQALSLTSIENLDEQAALLACLHAFKHSRNVTNLSASAKERLDELMPLLLDACYQPTIAMSCTSLQAVERLVQWLEAIVNRTSYLVLMLENPQVLQHLVRLLAQSSWVAQTLTEMPSLLDELLSPANLYSFPEKPVLRDELRQAFLRLDPEDTEVHMEVLRYFKLSHHLRVVACEIAGSLPLTKVSDYLSYTAEVIVEQVVMLAWQALVQRHGYPPGTADDNRQFLVVGYGKLGGIEMGYGSDLDLVFIYEGDAQGMTNGSKALDCQTFYTRLGQKIIHFLNTRTLSGQLYDVDMRLRPSGNSGLLVSAMSAFARYQEQDAWTWEHQALVRARSIVGESTLREKFQRLRHSILIKPRDLAVLRQDVLSMREKMREHLAHDLHAEKDKFHVKQDAGGIVDIEFMVQYAVLAWSHQHCQLSQWTDNIRILETLEQLACVEPRHTRTLIDIYQSYRTATHRLALQQLSTSLVDSQVFTEQRRDIQSLWARWFYSG